MKNKNDNKMKKSGSTPLYYWDIISGNENLLETYKVTIDKIRNGNLKSADFDLKVHAKLKIYSVKSNKADRLFFTDGIVAGKRALILLEVLKFHHYRKAKSFQIPFVEKSKRQAEATTIVDEENVFIDVEDAELNELQQLIEDINDDDPQPVVQYINDFLVLNDIQKESLSMRTPLLLNGVPGGGKTLIGKEYLQKYSAKFKNKRFLYLTNQSTLAERVGKILAADNISEERVKCSTYTQEIIDNTDCKQLISEEERLEWLKKYIKTQSILDSNRASSSKSTPLPSLPNDTNTLLKEFFIISGCLNMDDYDCIGQKDSQFSKQEKQLIWDCFTDYKSFLEKEKRTDVNFSSHKWKTKYFGIFVDESQDLIPNQLKQLMSLAYNQNIVFSSDTTQTTTEQKSVNYFLLKLVNNNQINLDTNYRNPPMVKAFDNIILGIGYNLIGGARDKEMPLPKPLDQNVAEMPVTVYWINENDALTLDNLNYQSVDFVVVTLPKYLEEAKAKFKTKLVVTIAQVKGHQADYLVMYKVFDALDTGTILNDDARTRSINVTIDDEKAHLSKSREVPQYYYNFIANLHVAISRTLRILYVYEDKNTIYRIKYLLDLIDSKINLLQNTAPFIPNLPVSDDSKWVDTKVKLSINTNPPEETTLNISNKKRNKKRTKKRNTSIQNAHLEVAYIDNLCDLIKKTAAPSGAESLLKKLDNEQKRQEAINTKSTSSMTPFMVAAQSGRYSLLLYMLSCFPVENDKITLLTTEDSSKMNALDHAVWNNHSIVFQRLLGLVDSIDDKVKLLNKIMGNGDSPLMYAAQKDYIGIFQAMLVYFIKNEADKNEADKTVFCDQQLMQLIEFNSPSKQWNAPFLAVEHKNSAFLASMLNVLSQENCLNLIRREDTEGCNLLSLSVLKNDLKLVSTVLTYTSPTSILDLVKSSSIDKWYIMRYIAFHAHNEILQFIINSLDCDQKNLLDVLMYTNKEDMGVSCLISAVLANNIKAVEMILNSLKDHKDKESLVLQKTINGLTAYSACSPITQVEIYKFLEPYFEKSPASTQLFTLPIPNFEEYTLLDCKRIKEYIKAIADRDLRAKKARQITPGNKMSWLMHAAGSGNVDFINYIFTFYQGKNTEAELCIKYLYVLHTDKNGMTAVDFAIRHNQSIALIAILDHIAEKHDKLRIVNRRIGDQMSALMFAARTGNLDIIKETLDYFDNKKISTESILISTGKPYAYTILEHAISARQADVVMYLVRYILHHSNKNKLFPSIINKMDLNMLKDFLDPLEPQWQLEITNVIFGDIMIIRYIILADYQDRLHYLLSLIPDEANRIELLLTKNINDKGMNALITAVQKNNVKMVALILNALSEDSNKRTLVNQPCITGANAYNIAVALAYNDIQALLKPYYQVKLSTKATSLNKVGLFKNENPSFLNTEEILSYLNKIEFQLQKWTFFSTTEVRHLVNDKQLALKYLDILNNDGVGRFDIEEYSENDLLIYCYIVCKKLDIEQILYQFYQHDYKLRSNNKNGSHTESNTYSASMRNI